MYFGPDQDFFDQTGLDLVQNFEVRILQKTAKIVHEIGCFWHLLNKSDNFDFTVKVLKSLDFSAESGFLKKMGRVWAGVLKKMVRM